MTLVVKFIVLDLAGICAVVLNLRRTPSVMQSTLFPVPFVMGLRHPVVVLPARIQADANELELESILLHEMAHVARWDQWVALWQRLATILFWWNPILYRINAHLSSVREDLCDNHVIRHQGSGFHLAHALVDCAAQVVDRGSIPSALGFWKSDGEGLKARVFRLLEDGRKNDTRLSGRAVALVVCFSVMLLTALPVAQIRLAHGSAASDFQPNGRVIRVKNADEFRRAVATAKPGTKILLAPGNYAGGFHFSNLRGKKGNPIILAAAKPNNPPVIEGGVSCLHLSDPAYVEFHNLVLTKARVHGINIDDGGTLDTPAHHIVLRGMVVRDIGRGGNHDGIKLAGVDDFRVEDCTVERWGNRGSAIDMVGCHRGLDSGSTFRNGDKIFGNGVQTKGGSEDITIQYCRFINAGGRAVNIGGSTGLKYFRPRLQKFEARDITVEDCTFIGSMAPIAFVGVDGAIVRHNTIYRPTRWVVRILQESRGPRFVPCRNGKFSNNIVVFRSDELAYAVNIGSGTAPKTFTFGANFWYCFDRPGKTRRSVRLPTAESNGIYGTNPLFEDLLKGDLRLQNDSPARKQGPRKRDSQAK